MTANTFSLPKYRVIDCPFSDVPIPYQEDFNAAQILSEMPAVAIRSWAGHWCGYVGVSKSHSLYEIEDSMDNYELFPTVHGGITFTSHSPSKDNCVGLPNANLWWIGFDCGHYGDMSPNVLLPSSLSQGTYRDIDYVVSEILSLIDQLKGTYK